MSDQKYWIKATLVCVHEYYSDVDPSEVTPSAAACNESQSILSDPVFFAENCSRFACVVEVYQGEQRVHSLTTFPGLAVISCQWRDRETKHS